jgi:formate dehydrogenase major subunit/NADH-quinone oxidoreductase subunit G
MNKGKETVTLTINGQTVIAKSGTILLWAALENGIYIPNLCAIKDKPEPEASCRLCWVEIKGGKEPVTACTVEVKDGMAVNAKGEKALSLARAGFDLLMASHALDCAHCKANGRCELQKIAKTLKCSLKPKKIRLLLRNLPVDDSNPLFTYDPNKCVLCGRCVWACKKHKEKAMLGFAHRGFNRMLTTFGDEPIGKDRCLDCSACVNVCPTGALGWRGGKKGVVGSN